MSSKFVPTLQKKGDAVIFLLLKLLKPVSTCWTMGKKFLSFFEKIAYFIHSFQETYEIINVYQFL